jgi:hypothetical protein
MGFSDQQAEAPVKAIEGSLQSGFERFVEVLKRQLKDPRAEIHSEMMIMRTEIAQLRVEASEIRGDMGSLGSGFQSSLRDQLFKMISLIVSVAGLGIAIIKLFPNGY